MKSVCVDRVLNERTRMYETGFMNEHELEGSRSGSKSGPCVIAACVMIETET